MSHNVRVVFVFSRDDELIVFPSLKDAAEWMEAIDVDHGEYPAVLALDGRVITVRTESDRVVLDVTDESHVEDLHERLRDHVKRLGLMSRPDDPQAVANEIFRLEWEHRWPRWPAWLSRRLHGDGPVHV